MKNDIIRCDWAYSDLLVEYHDNEWGDFTLDDRKHFEFLCLEGFQAGLNWEIILKKREAMTEMFRNFDPEILIKLKRKEFESIYNDARGIRNRMKIDAVLNNAECFLRFQDKHGSFGKHIFEYIGSEIVVGDYESWKAVVVDDRTGRNRH